MPGTPESPNTSSKWPKKKTNWIWEHSVPRSDGRWECKHCKGAKKAMYDKQLPIMKHLENSHGIRNPNKKQPQMREKHARTDIESDVEDSDVEEADNSQVQWHQLELPHVVDKGEIRYNCLRMVLVLGRPFSDINHEVFHDLITACHCEAEKLLPSQQTVQWDVISLHKQGINVVWNLLQRSLTNCHLSFDLWTSSNLHSYLVVITHWVLKNYQLRQCAIALKNLDGRHTGDNIGGLVMDVARQYGIVPNLGCFILDNTWNNDSSTNVICEASPDPIFDKVEWRLQCIAHI